MASHCWQYLTPEKKYVEKSFYEVSSWNVQEKNNGGFTSCDGESIAACFIVTVIYIFEL